MLLMIDNYDSFTYNLVQYFGELGADVEVARNDEITLEDIVNLQAQRIVISPGPCTPNEAGLSLQVIAEFAGKLPLLGVCLGHQCIGQHFGGRIIRAAHAMHGKTSEIYHTGEGVFSGLPSPFIATRYHSLVVDATSIPEELEVSAWTQTANGERDEIMGLRNSTQSIEGVQFHPESILSEHGHALLQNFLNMDII